MTSGNLTTLVSVAYPLGDLMLIMVGARLVLGAGPRSPSLYLIAGYLGCGLYADTAYTIQSLDGTYQPPATTWTPSGSPAATCSRRPCCTRRQPR
ncbi:hypothetical protein GCM10023107_97520 [Actinoplanes octamycinicus]|uniref:hypothetical protein n=1 Tax=Actinoplanes octamycinicus TaxID=135948 RepID=UPI0031E76DE4